MRNFLRSGLAVAMIAVPSVAWAIGGSDSDPGNQIGKDTARCQAIIAKESSRFSAEIQKAVARCFDAVLRCEQSKDASDHDQCISALLVDDRGRCAHGVLGSVSAHVGAGSGSGALGGAGIDSSAIGRAHLRFVTKIGRRCIDPEVDLTDSGTGLGVGAGPFSDTGLSDALNGIPNGVGCSAHRLVRNAYPLTDEFVSILVGQGDAPFVIDLLDQIDGGSYMDCQ